MSKQSKKAKPVHAHLRTPRVLLGLLIIAFIVAVVAFAYLSPKSEEEVSDYIDEKFVSYCELYLGLTNVSVKNKTLKDGVWTADVRAVERYGPIKMDMLMYDSNKSIFKIYESITPPSKPITIMETGKGSCSFEGLTTADIYIDPYDRWTIAYDDLIINFTKTFSKSLRVQYRLLPTYSVDAMKEAGNDARHAFLYFSCIKNDEKFDAARKCVYDKYQEKEDFLNESEIQNSVVEAGFDLADVKNCAGGSDALTELSIDERFGGTYLPEPITPSVVIDCKYRTFPTFANRVFCYLYPLNSACQ